jgi:PAS domain S-box-containing protein
MYTKKIVNMICGVFSVSKEKHQKAQNNVLPEHELVNNVISNIPHFVFWKNLDSEYLGCNNKFARNAGLKHPDDIIGKTDYDLVWTKEESAFYRKCDREVMSSGTPVLNMEETQLLADGSEINLLTSKMPLRDSDGKITGIIGVCTDITKRKKLEKTLESLARFPDENPSPVLRVSKDGIILYRNNSAKQLLSESEPNIIDRVSKEWHNFIKEALISEKCIAREVEIENKIFSLTFAPIKESGYINIYGQDITKRAQVNMLLKESEEHLRLKLDSILSPQLDFEEDELRNMLDIPAIQSSMENFSHATGMSTAIVNLKGNVLVATGWQDICVKFHRVHPKSRENCIKSDVFLTQNIKRNEFKEYRCYNGLRDIATPIFIGNKHVGNAFFGQFLYDDEVIDIEKFIAQAEEYGFEKDAYLRALKSVPRINRKKAKNIIQFMMKFSTLISKLSYSNLMLAKSISKQKLVDADLSWKTAFLEAQIESTTDGTLVVDEKGDTISFNQRFMAIWGIKYKVLTDLNSHSVLNAVISKIMNLPQYLKKVEYLYANPNESSVDEIECKDGTILERYSSPVIGSKGQYFGRIWNFHDITGRKRTEKEFLKNQEQLKALAIQLASSEEQERKRIAEGLHDDIIQPLFFLDIKLKTLLDGDIKEDLPACYQQMRTILQKLINDIRHLTFDLTNPVLHELGLEKAIEQYLLSEIKKKHKLKCIFKKTDRDTILDYDLQTFLFKAVKELVVNVVKHAKATTINIILVKDKNNILISVSDDGVGFFVNNNSNTKKLGFGLFNLRNRIEYFGGCLDIKSKPGNGTQVVIMIALKEETSIREEANQ